MSTKKFAARLIAYVSALWLLILFIPWSLNARSSLVNSAGIAVLIGIWVAAAAFLHKKLSKK
jgi:hypothetical protein